MKNRKLFAIITLVAFMLTMMPFMAFAADLKDAKSGNIKVLIDSDDTSVKIGNSVTATVKVQSGYQIAAGQEVVVYATINGAYTDAITYGGANTIEPDYAAVTAGKDITITPTKAGTYKIKAVLVDPAQADSQSLKDLVAAGYAVTVDADTITARAKTGDVVIEETVTGNDFTAKYEKGVYTGAKANNGAEKGIYEVELALTQGTDEVANQEVTIEIDKSTGYVSKTTAKTNSAGIVKFKVSATKAGVYTVSVNSKNADEKDIKFDFSANNTAQVIGIAPEAPVATNNDLKIKLKVIDASGTTLSGEALKNAGLGGFGVEFTKVPAASDTDTAVNYVGDGIEFDQSEDPAKLVIDGDLIDEAGAYTIKIYNKTTGGAKYVDFTAAEYGKTVSATIEYDAASYNLGAKVTAPTVKIVDANGVTKDADKATKFSFTGAGVVNFNENTGAFLVTSDDKYLGQTITVNVIVDKCIATTTVSIADVPAYLKFTDATAAIGTEATVVGNSADLKGNLAAIGEGYGVSVNYVVVQKPEGAVVSVDTTDLEKEAFIKEGKGNIKVACTKEGTVKVNVVVTAVPSGQESKAGKNIYLTGVATVGFGAAPIDNGVTSTVTLIIGSKTFVANGSAYTSDVAPYVANGRTFVPVRAFAEATGAKVEYDAATQVITITAEGLNAQMTIGSNILTVNGQTTVMDVAAAVTADGRTVLPVRFAGQALGYGFEVAYGSNGAVSSVTMFK